jgi:hypothetical protein
MSTKIVKNILRTDCFYDPRCRPHGARKFLELAFPARNILCCASGGVWLTASRSSGKSRAQQSATMAIGVVVLTNIASARIMIGGVRSLSP